MVNNCPGVVCSVCVCVCVYGGWRVVGLNSVLLTRWLPQSHFSGSFLWGHLCCTDEDTGIQREACPSSLAPGGQIRMGVSSSVLGRVGLSPWGLQDPRALELSLHLFLNWTAHSGSQRASRTSIRLTRPQSPALGPELPWCFFWCVLQRSFVKSRRP